MAIDLSDLNPEQREAVLHGAGPLLILAGAGSGKTRVITHRIARLVQEMGVAPWQVLAVTFTNKAAGEMRERIQRLLGPQGAEVQATTFHSFGANLLRREAELVGRTRSAVIYDDADQLALIKRVMRSQHIDERAVPPRAIAHRLDKVKNEGLPPSRLFPDPEDDAGLATIAVYPLYERALAEANAFDFGDLIVKVVELFDKHPEVCDRYRRRYAHVLVDEFQDTNPAQFALLRHLRPPGSNLCVVGDDDQAIYRWRGADVENILSFDRHYPGCRIVKLERNYRSSATILDAAYGVISAISRRRPKRLFTEADRGLPLALLASVDDRSEASEVVSAIRSTTASGTRPTEIAVFYRTNAQSRVLEEALRTARVPYRIFRGRSFYERAEVKDVVAYLRVALNPQSDTDILRIINTPPRGIGDTTVERLEQFAERSGLGLFQAMARSDEIDQLNAGARRRLAEFSQVMARMSERAQDPRASTAIQEILQLSGLIEALESEGSAESEGRVENLLELVSAAREFEEAPRVVAPDEPAIPMLAAFLESVSLISDEADLEDTGEEKVSMMTLHSAKGLEFDCVFMTGMEETLLPHSKVLGDEAEVDDLDEERRLCYVGITRARKRLVFSLARSRMQFGEIKRNLPSRFLTDIPRELFAFEGGRGPKLEVEKPGRELHTGERIVYDAEYAPRRMSATPRREGPRADQLGGRVRHEVFGEGLVRHCDGSGPEAKVLVDFPRVGLKKVLARFLTRA